CWYSNSLITPQRMMKAGQYVPNQRRSGSGCRTCMVVSNSTTPSRIRMTGPAIERRGLRGCGCCCHIGGGVCVGLAILHLRLYVLVRRLHFSTYDASSFPG